MNSQNYYFTNCNKLLWYIHSFIHSLSPNSFINSFIHSFSHLFIHSFTYSFLSIHSIIYLLFCNDQVPGWLCRFMHVYCSRTTVVNNNGFWCQVLFSTIFTFHSAYHVLSNNIDEHFHINLCEMIGQSICFKDLCAWYHLIKV